MTFSRPEKVAEGRMRGAPSSPAIGADCTPLTRFRHLALLGVVTTISRRERDVER